MARTRSFALLSLVLAGCGGGGSSNVTPPIQDFSGVYEGTSRDGNGSILGATVGRVSESGHVQFQISSNDATAPDFIEGTLSNGTTFNGEARLPSGDVQPVNGSVVAVNGNTRFALTNEEDASQIVLSMQERTWIGTYVVELGLDRNVSYS